MSTGFRLFLLILVGFGAIHAYRFRAVEIHRWLRAEPAEPLPGDPRLGFVSPVDRVLEADVSWAWLLGSARTIEQPLVEASSDDVEVPETLPEDVLDPEGEALEIEAADLPVSEDVMEAPEGEPVAESITETVENPQEPAAPGAVPEDLSGSTEQIYRVESGDSLWKIATRTLGSGNRYREILEWNRELFQRVNPELLPAGTQLKIRLPAGHEILKEPRQMTDTPVAERSATGKVSSRRARTIGQVQRQGQRPGAERR